MRPPTSSPSASRGRFARAQAFTLVEILFVVTIIIIVLTAAGATIPGALASQRLSFAARQLSADLNQASLLARKENRVVEMRFYLMPSLQNPRETAYRAYQAGLVTGWDPVGNAITHFPTEIVRLPEDVGLMPDAKYNSLQTLELIKSDDPNKAGGASYVSYFIQSNGTTTLPQAQSVVITLVKEKGGLVPTVLPADFRSVVIDPQTHQNRVY